jgi:hypothetical protein
MIAIKKVVLPQQAANRVRSFYVWELRMEFDPTFAARCCCTRTFEFAYSNRYSSERRDWGFYIQQLLNSANKNECSEVNILAQTKTTNNFTKSWLPFSRWFLAFAFLQSIKKGNLNNIFLWGKLWKIDWPCQPLRTCTRSWTRSSCSRWSTETNPWTRGKDTAPKSNCRICVWKVYRKTNKRA